MTAPTNKTKGPCIIKAGAGTGKTYQIIEKIKHLVKNNLYKPEEILCLTFSNEATNELKNRLAEEIKDSSEATIKTFHSFCADILKEEGHFVKVDPEFQILPPEDAKILFHKYLEVTPYWANRYVATISTSRDFGISLKEIKEHVKQFAEQFAGIEQLDLRADELDLELKTLHLASSDTKEEKKKTRDRKKEVKQFLDNYYAYNKYLEFIAAWEGYEKIKKDRNYLDYSDLNNYVNELFQRTGAEKFAKKYKYIFVDEFQDTNKLQFELIEYLGKEHHNLTIVGDPNQSIYGFRGAYKQSFEHFKKIFGVTKDDEFTLDKSRRSPNTILDVSHQLIKNNYENEEECISIQNFEDRKGKPVKCFQLINADEEARKIAELVEEEIEKGTPLSEICVLFRTHRQSKLIQQALESKGIPIISAGDLDLLSQPEIKTVISYLGILNNLRERSATGEQAWWNLFHYHNTLTPEDSLKIGRYIKKRKYEDKEFSIDLALLTGVDKLQLSNEGKVIVHRVASKLKEILHESVKPLPSLILEIYELVGLNRAFSYDRTPRNVEAMMNLREFYNLAENYYQLHSKRLASFINYLEIVSDLGVNVPASRVTEVNAVRLMTIHATKGLQFDTVIVSNLAAKRFPITRTSNEPLIPKDLLPEQKKILDSLGPNDDPDEAIKEYEKEMLLVEERRLCYVAFTRAKNNLILTYAKSYNEKEDSATSSIFLEEIEFKTNENVEFVEDDEEKSMIFAPASRLEQFKSMLKKQLIDSLDTDDFQSLFNRLVNYHVLREGKVENYKKKVDFNLNYDQMMINLKMFKKKVSGLTFTSRDLVFSPTALLAYSECPKKYELGKILNMPSVSDFKWTAASAGSFVHQVLEDGVKAGFDSLKQFIEHAKKLSALSDWHGVDLKDVDNLLRIFWARNEGIYGSDSLVEQKLFMEVDGLRFFGLADRIDVSKEGVTIVDYKTNKNSLGSHERSWQLGYYALAAIEKGWKPKKLVLEMLRLDKPLEMEVDGDEVKGPDGRTKGFKLSEVKQELIDCAKAIIHDYEHEFMWVEDDKPCKWCGYKFYCPKWEGKQ
jgi:DNA helicase II / ATP-dependent DNA helicase PcrA